MKLLIDTKAKTITIQRGGQRNRAKYFAEQHDLLWMEIVVEENPITKLFILPNSESDAPKIDWDKGETHTLEFNQTEEDHY